MADSEFVRIAVFQLEVCAKRLLELAEQVESRPIHRRLASLSRELTEHAEALADNSLGPPVDGQA